MGRGVLCFKLLFIYSTERGCTTTPTPLKIEVFIFSIFELQTVMTSLRLMKSNGVRNDEGERIFPVYLQSFLTHSLTCVSL